MNGVPLHVESIGAGRTPVAFYGFVEGIDPLAQPDVDGYADTEYPAIQGLRRLRERMGLPPPTHVVWLDCVRQDLFDGLDWKHERCNSKDVDQRIRRRHHLIELPANAFVSSLMLISGRAEATLHRALFSAPWHRLVLGGHAGTPVIIGSDFETSVEGPFVTSFLSEREACVGDTLSPLLNVFSLDFLPDADLRGRGDSEPRSGSIPPWWPIDGDDGMPLIGFPETLDDPEVLQERLQRARARAARELLEREIRKQHAEREERVRLQNQERARREPQTHDAEEAEKARLQDLLKRGGFGAME